MLPVIMKYPKLDAKTFHILKPAKGTNPSLQISNKYDYITIEMGLAGPDTLVGLSLQRNNTFVELNWTVKLKSIDSHWSQTYQLPETVRWARPRAKEINEEGSFSRWFVDNSQIRIIYVSNEMNLPEVELMRLVCTRCLRLREKLFKKPGVSTKEVTYDNNLKYFNTFQLSVTFTVRRWNKRKITNHSRTQPSQLLKLQ